MTVHQPAALFQEQNVAAPGPLRRNRGERAFDLHPGVHAMVIACWSTFVAVLAATFMGPDLVVPAGILAVSVVALFLTPGLWGRVRPDDGAPKQSWGEFLEEGVDCLTGRLTAGQALAQIMVLPALLTAMAFVFAILEAAL